MRIEYENHLFLDSGNVLLWVTEWSSEKSPAVRRCYAFVPRVGRWLDPEKRVVLIHDPRHRRLLELMVAQQVEQEVDQLVGL